MEENRPNEGPGADVPDADGRRPSGRRGSLSDADPTLDELATVATRAVRASGDYLRDAFRGDELDAEYGTDDVKADADRIAEERIRSVLRESFADHAFHGEESGREGDHRFRWVVDPLDGTNNFASGLPSFATAVCVLRDGDPVVSAIYEPLPDSLYVARRGEGATVNGERIVAESDVPLDRGTVSFVRGLSAVRDPELRTVGDRIEAALRSRCKRVVQTWSPCVDWGLLARGGIEGIVCLHPEVYEQHAGELLAEESGVRSRGRGVEGLYVGAGDDETLSELHETVESAR
ncbi:inositol monophosphatase family protein [Halopelagius longus]|uniref:fructose-bisphosphatase n=1 Tax=Halopelagius longus TaxID=1236180 RepID=A0A1H1BT23_9EURY|nr:inositol monophosphatase [Halopelagius longus]RDI70906.1 inositol monophosphatase [Halopelagius longus]SDQ54910.1 myo-inositol-1(or 4)-monophosphatase [Halopelagius longus]